MALCESVSGCERRAEVTVPMFMGSVRLCGPCACLAGQDSPSTTPVVHKGDYVALSGFGGTVVGLVDRFTRGGWLVVRYARMIDGVATEILAYRRRWEVTPL